MRTIRTLLLLILLPAFSQAQTTLLPYSAGSRSPATTGTTFLYREDSTGLLVQKSKLGPPERVGVDMQNVRGLTERLSSERLYQQGQFNTFRSTSNSLYRGINQPFTILQIPGLTDTLANRATNARVDRILTGGDGSTTAYTKNVADDRFAGRTLTQSALDTRTPRASIAQVRADNMATPVPFLYLIDAGREGTFGLDPLDTSSPDNTGAVLVTGAGLRYKRQYTGAVRLDWFLTAGASDDAPAIQAALNEAYSRRAKVVRVPFRVGGYTIATTVTIPIGVVLEGDVVKPAYKTTGDPNIDTPTFNIRTAQDVTVPAFVLSYNAGIKNASFFWPDQVKTQTPKPYGWAITTTGQGSGADGVLVENITLTNAWNGINIDFGGQWNVRGIFGQVFNVGLRVDRMYDVSRIENIHFWEFWADLSTVAGQYAQQNGRAIVLGRTDDLKLVTIFAWKHKNAIHYTDFGFGSSWSQATNVSADNCAVPVQIDKVNRAQLTNVIAITGDKSTGRAGIETSTDIGGGEVQVVGFTTYQSHTGINISSSTGTFKLTNIIAQHRGADNSDVFGYKVINQSSAKVYLDEAEYSDVAGLVQIGPAVAWSQDTDVTFTNFATPHNWLDASSSRISAITGGSRFTLNGGISTARIDLPQSIRDNAGIYVLECDLLLNSPAGLGPGQFYLRLTDTNVNDIILPGSFINGFYVQKTHLRIPLIVRGNLTLQFVFGNASGACTMDMTGIKLWQVAPYKQTRTSVDWVHTKQPNSLNQLLPTVLK